jgi:hypothetical protein
LSATVVTEQVLDPGRHWSDCISLLWDIKEEYSAPEPFACCITMAVWLKEREVQISVFSFMTDTQECANAASWPGEEKHVYYH